MDRREFFKILLSTAAGAVVPPSVGGTALSEQVVDLPVYSITIPTGVMDIEGDILMADALRFGKWTGKEWEIVDG